MTGTMKRKRRKGKALRGALFLLAFFALAVILWAAGENPPLQGIRLTEDCSGSSEILLFQEQSNLIWLVFGRELWKLDACTGEVLLRRQTETPLCRAALGKGSLLVWEDAEPWTEVIAYDGALEESCKRELALGLGESAFLDCCCGETIAAVPARDRKTLVLLEPSGKERELSFVEPITFLGADPEGTLFLYAGSSLYRLDGSRQEWAESPGAVRPMAVLGRDLWVGEDGVVCGWKEGGAEPLFRCPENVVSSNFYCLDRENCLILSSGATVSRYDLTGKRLGSCVLEEPPAALCGSGALYRKDGDLYYVPLDFSQPLPSPSVTLSPSPSPVPEPEEEAPAWVEGMYLVARPGLTAARLRELMEPEAAEIRDRTGRLVTEGRLCTGMTVNDWTVVILGDCDGTGTVSGLDMAAAIAMVLEPVQKDPGRRAADLNGDGQVTAADLVLLSALLEK